MLEEVKVIMNKVGIVSCNKWQGKIKEDINLCLELQNLGIDAEIISWQQPIIKDYDLLILRSVWGYQNYYREFKKWLLEIKQRNIPLLNHPDMILSNILKNKQFEVLQKNDINCIQTYFLDKKNFTSENIFDILNGSLYCVPSVVKPTISGSGENTYLINSSITKPNLISSSEVVEKFKPILNRGDDFGVMLQPYISEINNGEYACIFIDGELTHTMLRFPDVFHKKKRPYLVKDVPNSILELAEKVENISDFKNYLYMRVDMVLVDGKAKIMEVELAEPDLLTKYIDDKEKQKGVIKTLAKKIEGRLR